MFELLLPWVTIIVALAVPLLLFIGRNWIKAWIEKGVQHRFDVRLEEVKAKVRDSETRLKSELSQREGEIASLRNIVLNGSAGRRALLDKRQFDAVEKVWTAVNDLGRLKALSANMAVLNIEAISKQNSNPKIQEFLTMLGKNSPDISEMKDVALNEKPFLPELAWAYFSTIRKILIGNLFLFQVLRTGMENPMHLLNRESIGSSLKATLPERSEWIESHAPEQYYYLLEELEDKLLGELRKVLDGTEADQAAVKQAKLISGALRQADLGPLNLNTVDIESEASDLGILAQPIKSGS